jgi:hypothetical protein
MIAPMSYEVQANTLRLISMSVDMTFAEGEIERRERVVAILLAAALPSAQAY